MRRRLAAAAAALLLAGCGGDEQARVVRALDDVSVDVDDPAALENLLLRLHIALSARE